MNINEREEWLEPNNLEFIAEMMEACESGEMLQSLRQIYPDFAMKAAVKYLTEPATKERIKKWVIEQNNLLLVAA